jgi:hypothetical protein
MSLARRRTSVLSFGSSSITVVCFAPSIAERCSLCASPAIT